MKRFSFLKSDKGGAAIEAAIIMPFLVFLYFGLQDLTSLITYNRKVTATSATISDTVAQYQSTVVRSSIIDIFNAVDMTMQPLSSSKVHVDVYGFRMNGGVATQIWKVANTGAPTCPAVDTTNFNNMMTSGNDLIVSVSCMQYAPWIADFMGKSVLGATTFSISQQITSRPRSATTLDCVTTSGGTTACNG
jgi:Flp pilus assembly protein TadG